ncbi:putative transcriptional regulator [Treponema primitia ZAS-2]|uniref:Putative transcriptional regulator n=1 Tax=Treponema primitia (strain ATCC BAA-887 / DSM 12427 / ZAS-2) TaxID=545694 RepID=F5YHM1_TREPZ|nr:DNA/RNA nuclease SfsA [Treponema primitia]AEF86061.1 putative transcriptional regulator [Treponema primitia ZAS-2]
MGESYSLFTNHREAVFLRRPNRFLIIAAPPEEGAGGEVLVCHCPNPGRLMEFAFPGTRLILEKRDEENLKAKTAWTAAGLYHRNTVVPLFASRANGAAEKLILKEIIPGLTEIHPEYTLGPSRFDFLCLDNKKRKHLVEVKACSLIEYQSAMFPDAPSGRALKHLEELAELSSQGYCCHILFVITHSKPRVFIPNLHTDPEFAAALSRCGHAVLPFADASAGDGPVAIHAALIRCDSQGRAKLVSPAIPVDLSHGKLADSNSGNYLILLELPREQAIEIGALGTIAFKSGWYVYTGSARKNLSQRVNRHLRHHYKQKHWHLDYLTPQAGKIKALPIMSYRNLECGLARDLEKIGGLGIPGFGSSDCRCDSHLFYFTDPPMENRDFVDLILRYRHRDALKRDQGNL